MLDAFHAIVIYGSRGRSINSEQFAPELQNQVNSDAVFEFSGLFICSRSQVTGPMALDGTARLRLSTLIPARLRSFGHKDNLVG